MAGSVGTGSGVFSEELLKSLECPVCFKYMTGPIHTCVTGHSICSQCRQLDVKECPVCTAQFHHGRNFLAEDLAKHIIFPCENKDHGCTMRVLGSEVEQHHVTCSYRMYKCPMDCKWTGRRVHLAKHFTDAHPKSMFHSTSLAWTWVGSFTAVKSYYLMCAYGELFLLFVHVDSNKKYLTACVHYIGEAQRASVFNYTVTLKTNDGRRSLSYTDMTKNDSSDFQTIADSTELFLLNEDMCKNFTGKDGKVCLNFIISRR